MKYFVSAGEDLDLDATTRRSLRGSYVELSDGVTHYEITGPENGPLVVMAGGLTVPLSYWDEMADHLHDRGLRTLTYSAYGRGYSDRVVGRYDEALFVRQLTELIDCVGECAPYHLIGTSMGALVSMAYLAPESTRRPITLTLAGPAGLSQQPAIQRFLLGNDLTAYLMARIVGRRIFDQHLGRNVRDADRASALHERIVPAYRYRGSLYAFFSTLRYFPLFGRAALYQRTGDRGLPTLLLWGADDDVTPISAFHDVVALLRPAGAHVLDCGHMAPFERPADVAAEMANFVAAHSERS